MDKGQHKALYSAFMSKDPRFDGRFFVGVTSTGIYCRPVCPARMPKEENCIFFSTAAEAEKAGYRPCLMCRPELAPGISSADIRSNAARKAAKYIEENCGYNTNLKETAAKLGYSDRHMRRLFYEEYHVTPIEYMQTCRLLLAKSLLTDTKLSVVDISMASGFGSLRRFNDLFQKKYHLSPRSFRNQAEQGKNAAPDISIALGYRPPYAWEKILQFLAMRSIPGVEVVADNTYSRTVKVKDKSGNSLSGYVSVSNNHKKNLVFVNVSENLLPVLPLLLGRIRNLFDLNSAPRPIADTLSGMNTLIPGVFKEGIRVPGCFDPFELCVRTILGQQITVKAASTLSGRLAFAFGSGVECDISGLSYTFPTAEDILSLGETLETRFGEIGIIAARARAIKLLAQKISEGEINFDLCDDPGSEIEKLMEIPGIGSWTAKYIAMRALEATDILPDTDLGIRKALGGKTPKEIVALSEEWRPWRSYATMSLWDSLHKGQS